jgi:hypothetical protein
MTWDALIQIVTVVGGAVYLAGRLSARVDALEVRVQEVKDLVCDLRSRAPAPHPIWIPPHVHTKRSCGSAPATSSRSIYSGTRTLSHSQLGSGDPSRAKT